VGPGRGLHRWTMSLAPWNQVGRRARLADEILRRAVYSTNHRAALGGIEG